MLKRLLGSMSVIVLLVPALAQDGQPKVTTEGAPLLQIVSAPIKLEREKRKVRISIEVKNTSDKIIKAFGWQFRMQGQILEYDFSSKEEMPEVSVVLPPNGKKKVVLLKASHVAKSFFDLPIREIRIVSITFEDGSSWRRNKDD